MALPFLTPIIVAAGTTLVGDFFQKQNSKIRLARENRLAILTKAHQIYDEVSKKIDTLYYYMSDEAIYIAVRVAKNDKTKLAQDTAGWTMYEASVADWKSNKNRLISEIEIYYGYELTNLLENISIIFQKADSLINATYYKTDRSLVTEIKKKSDKEEAEYKVYAGKIINSLDELEPFIRLLNREMIQSLQSEKVGNLRLQ